jgi:hypothetical protein
LITDPSEKQFFTRSELELVNGIASKPGDQDDLTELMTMSDEEKVFWTKNNTSPNFMINDRLGDEIDSEEEKEYF